jgi:hypothetical protein
MLVNLRKSHLVKAGSRLCVDYLAATESVRCEWTVEKLVICEDISLFSSGIFVVTQLFKSSEQTAGAERSSQARRHQIV